MSDGFEMNDENGHGIGGIPSQSPTPGLLVSNESPIDALPPKYLEYPKAKLFECFIPKNEPVISQIQTSVPFPATMLEALTYAVGYIDQSATTSRTLEQKYEILKKRYQAATERISGDIAELEKLRGRVEPQTFRITELEDLLALKERLSQRLQRGITRLQTQQGLDDDTDSPRFMEMQEKLQQESEQKAELKSNLEAAIKSKSLLGSQLAAQTNLNIDLEVEKSRLIAKLEKQEVELLVQKKALAQGAAELAAAKHHIDVDGHIIAGIQIEREALAKSVRELTQQIVSIKQECAEARKLLKAELDETLAKLEIVEDEKQALEEEHQQCAARLRAAEEANKPVMQNTVVLKNPIAIAGSLSGCTERIDDRVFAVPTLDFPITVYGYQSSNIFVTDNGMLWLDAPPNGANKKLTGERLPHRAGLAQYTLFPFWTDLMLAQGKPHGIFYETTGTAGTRQFAVEWYVTRYGQEDQYFHFSVLFEEDKPGVVTYKYYDAVDQGVKCTIGIQGPSDFHMFSHNQATVHPGLQIVFDTTSKEMRSFDADAPCSLCGKA